MQKDAVNVYSYLPSSISIIARNSFSASGSSFLFVFTFDLYAALARGGFGASSSSLSSSSEMTTRLLALAVLLVDSVRLDLDGDLARVLTLADSSSSESEGIGIDLSLDPEGLLCSGLGAALDDAGRGGSSSGSALILRVSVAGFGAVAATGGFALAALLKSSFPEGLAGFEGSSLICGLTSFGSDLTTGFTSSAIEGAFDRPGSLFLEVVAVAEDFAFDEDRLCWRSVHFCSME